MIKGAADNLHVFKNEFILSKTNNDRMEKGITRALPSKILDANLTRQC